MCYEDSISVFAAGFDDSTNKHYVTRIEHHFEEDKDQGIEEEAGPRASFQLRQARPSQSKSQLKKADTKLGLITDSTGSITKMIRLQNQDGLQWIDLLGEDEASEICSCTITHKLASISGAVEADAQIVFNALDCNE